jgi:hypothetical protein
VKAAGVPSKQSNSSRPKSGKQEPAAPLNPREEQVIRDLKTLIFKVEQLLRSSLFI